MGYALAEGGTVLTLGAMVTNWRTGTTARVLASGGNFVAVEYPDPARPGTGIRVVWERWHCNPKAIPRHWRKCPDCGRWRSGYAFRKLESNGPCRSCREGSK